MTTLQRIPTIEQALWLINEDLSAEQLIYDIEDWLGKICQRDFDYGWNAFKDGKDRDSLVNEAQRRGFDAAVANYDEDCREDAAMRLETIERF